MTNESTNETTAPEEEKTPRFETGFIVLKGESGAWHVLTDLSSKLEIDREVSVNEVRAATTEITYSIGQQQLAALILSALSPQPADTATEDETESTIKE
jgi:hypothetical protein